MLRFGAFALDPVKSELRRNGVLIRLQHQPLKALALLATRAGEVVTRDDLRREIWPEGTFVDFERGLNFCINRIRRTLDETRGRRATSKPFSAWAIASSRR